VIVEHPVRSDWKLVEPTKPAERTRDVYRFEVTAPPGKSVKLEVAEEQERVDPVALATGGDLPPRYPVAAGVEVKPVVKTSAPELLGLKIVKGVLHARSRVRESRTYFVQNTSEEKRTFLVDHVIRADWKLLPPEGKEQAGPGVYRFTLEVPAGKSAFREVVEERTELNKGTAVKNATSLLVQQYLASQVVSKEVKAALEKVNTLYAAWMEGTRELDDAAGQLKALSDDQARLRSNLQVIPQSSEPYKKFLEKFLEQETQIGTLQRQVRQLQPTVDRQRRAYASFVADLTVE
jgi:hypothetical protein